jgi:toxin CptA
VQFPIIIGLHRSRFMDAAVLMTALLATAAIVGFPRAHSIQAVLLLITWGLAMLAWRQLKPTIMAIRLERNGHLLIARSGETEFLPAEPEPGATVHPWLTVLHLKTEDGFCTTLIAAVDSLKREDFRRLRMFLRWQAKFSVPGDDA